MNYILNDNEKGEIQNQLKLIIELLEKNSKIYIAKYVDRFCNLSYLV